MVGREFKIFFDIENHAFAQFIKYSFVIDDTSWLSIMSILDNASSKGISFIRIRLFSKRVPHNKEGFLERECYEISKVHKD